MTGQPLTAAEVAELDTYGHIHGRIPLPRRAIELWEREILYGHVDQSPDAFQGIVSTANPIFRVKGKG